MPQQQSPRRPQPRRVVHYKVVIDALGPYVSLMLDDVLLPHGIPAHRLPRNAKLEWVQLEWRFLPGTASTGASELRRLFLEFAEQMNWDARLQP